MVINELNLFVLELFFFFFISVKFCIPQVNQMVSRCLAKTKQRLEKREKKIRGEGFKDYTVFENRQQNVQIQPGTRGVIHSLAF